MKRRFRKLRPGENPDRAEGDQCQDTGNGYWILAQPYIDGSRPVIPGEHWRRPISLKPTDLDEHTIDFT